MRICALILNWERPDETIRCLNALATHALGIDVLVVDNASADDSIERIRQADSAVPILQNARNEGYAGGNNAGFRLLLDETVADDAILHGAAPEPPAAILVLNNDVEILPGSLDALEAAATRDPGRGILAPVSLDASDPELLDFHRARIDLPNMAVHALGRGERLNPMSDVESDYAPGSAFLIRSAVLDALGGFDDRFFLVWEDVDLSLRAAKHGFGKPLIVANARVLHEGSVSFGGAATPRYRYFYVRNSYLIAERHLSGWRRRRTIKLLDRRYRGWIEQSADPALAAAIRLGIEHAHAGAYGPALDART